MSTAETARYISEFSAELSYLAREAKLDLLAYLLDMARLEAFYTGVFGLRELFRMTAEYTPFDRIDKHVEEIVRRPDLVELAPAEGGADRAVTGSRAVSFDDDWVETPTHSRRLLAPGDVVHGPAVIEEFGSTVPVHPGFRATVDVHGNLLIERDAR